MSSFEKFKERKYIWNTFEIKKMKDYHNFYLKCVVLLLADMFDNFRSSRFKNYGLYPSHYFSAPTLS